MCSKSVTFNVASQNTELHTKVSKVDALQVCDVFFVSVQKVLVPEKTVYRKLATNCPPERWAVSCQSSVNHIFLNEQLLE